MREARDAPRAPLLAARRQVLDSSVRNRCVSQCDPLELEDAGGVEGCHEIAERDWRIETYRVTVGVGAGTRVRRKKRVGWQWGRSDREHRLNWRCLRFTAHTRRLARSHMQRACARSPLGRLEVRTLYMSHRMDPRLRGDDGQLKLRENYRWKAPAGMSCAKATAGQKSRQWPAAECRHPIPALNVVTPAKAAGAHRK